MSQHEGNENARDDEQMSHVDEDTIALLALGESMSTRDDDHVRSCVSCQAKVDQLSAIVHSARSVTDEDKPVAPPNELWDRIAMEIDSDEQINKPAAPRGARMGWFALAAAVGLLAGSVGTAVVMNQSEPAPAIAQATLEPLPGKDASGVAQVLQTADGPTLVIDVPDLPEPDGYYEVWMLTPEADSMVSIGVLGTGDVQEFSLPSGMDMESFPVVDISLEQFDGDVTHSTDSLVRGVLEA